MNIEIVLAIIDDAPAILALQKLAYQKEAILYDDWTIPPLAQTLPEIQAEFVDSVFLKALRAGQIVGSVRALFDSRTCRIGRLMVHPDCQRNGIGSSLMKSIETVFSEAKRFELFTGTRSADNIRLYQKLGYSEYRQQDLSPRVRIILMEKLQ